MKVFADSSFIVSMVVPDAGSSEAKGVYLSQGRPELLFTPMHDLEVRNAIRVRGYQDKLSSPAREMPRIKREQAEANDRLNSLFKRRVLVSAALDWQETSQRACEMSEKHSFRLGTRSLDILQVASALVMRCDLFLTGDTRQAALAKAEGIRVILINAE